MDIFAAATLLFLVMDPLGNIPLFLSVLKQVPEERRRLVLRRELLIAYLVLLIFLVLGPPYFEFLTGVSRSHSDWRGHCIISDCDKDGVSKRRRHIR